MTPNIFPIYLSIDMLLRRWRCGSRASLRRAESNGLLIPRRVSGRLLYLWPDVWAFEGGQPPKHLEAAYRAKMLTAEDISQLCPLSPSRIERLARRGDLPARLVFGKLRFVPVEVKAWLEAP